MNIVFRNNVSHIYINYWRKNKNDNTRDSYGKKFPWPKVEDSRSWVIRDQFLARLEKIENYLRDRKKFNQGIYNNKDCLICHKKDITTGSFNLNNIIWEDGLAHYVKIHEIKPEPQFIDKIFLFNLSKKKPSTIHYKSKLYVKDDATYVKLTRNQILILDALMKHGGYSKKYVDKHNENIFRYSEHAGLLDFGVTGLDKILISGNTTRIDRGDEEIYLPNNMPDTILYEYHWHSHPPEPPGSRISIPIVYEFPSVSDLFHFIDHHNDGIMQGSLVITPEGLYNIRKYVFNANKIRVDENKLLREMTDVMQKTQHKTVKKYGTKFTKEFFHETIAQDLTALNEVNSALNKYNLHIDYWPREKDKKGRWIIETIYLPIYIISRKKS